jgi:rubredoxin
MSVPSFKRAWSVSTKKTITTTNGQTQKCRSAFNFDQPTPNTPTKYESRPDELAVIITWDADVPKIHGAIHSRFVFFMIEKESLQREGELLVRTIDSLNPETLNYSRAVSRLQEIDDRIQDIDKMNNWTDYEREAVPILNEYSEIMTDENQKRVNEDPSTTERRIGLILTYVEIIRKYNLIKIVIYYDYDDANSCPSCGGDISDLELDVNKRYVCSTCGYYVDTVTQPPATQTDSITVPLKKTKPDGVVTMESWLNRFLGLSEDAIPDEDAVFRDFDAVCVEKGWPVGAVVRSKAVPSPDLDRLLYIMKLAGHTAYNKYRNYIRNKYWNWDLPVITDAQRSRFLSKAFDSQVAYPKYAKRSQNIQQDIRGWYLLKDAGCDFPRSMFKMTLLTSTLQEADEVYELICNDCDMTFHSILG